MLGLETYAGIDDRYGDQLDLVNDLCFVVFVVELALRIGAYGRRPWDFFRDGWNVFDFVVIGDCLRPRRPHLDAPAPRAPGASRPDRSPFPDLRVLLSGIWRSVPPLFAIALATGMLLFVYGMVGWTLFGDDLPEQWGNIGRAMLTLFVMLTLENFPAYMDAGMEVHPWSWVYFVSFVMIAAFVVINVLIGIVLNSMEEAREAERRTAVRERLGVDRPSVVDPDASAPVVERIAILRAALDELEAELSAGPEAARAGIGLMHDIVRQVLVLQHIACEPPGVYEDVLRERGATLMRVELDEGEPLPGLDGIAAIVAMGGPMSVNDEHEHPWLVAEKRLIRDAVGAGIPFFGACLGVQLFASSLGARVTTGSVPEVGVLPVHRRPRRPATTRSSPALHGRGRPCSGTATRSSCPTARPFSRPRPCTRTRRSGSASSPTACSSTSR